MKMKTLLPLAAGLLAGAAVSDRPGARREDDHRKNCSAATSASVGGDGSKIYAARFARVKTLPQLGAQGELCSTQLKTGWFPED